MARTGDPVLGVILAAGGGSRMGAAKALLPLRGSPLVHHHIRALRPVCQTIAVVLGSCASEIAPLLDGVVVVVNPKWESTWPADSLALALRALNPAGPVLVTPVDTPPADPSTLVALIEAGAPAVPTSQGRDGHPVLLSAALAQAIALRAPAGGLRALLLDARRVPVSAADTNVDFDTPSEWARYREKGGG